jgi:hypothetical protein
MRPFLAGRLSGFLACFHALHMKRSGSSATHPSPRCAEAYTGMLTGAAGFPAAQALVGAKRYAEHPTLKRVDG